MKALRLLITIDFKNLNTHINSNPMIQNNELEVNTIQNDTLVNPNDSGLYRHKDFFANYYSESESNFGKDVEPNETILKETKPYKSDSRKFM